MITDGYGVPGSPDLASSPHPEVTGPPRARWIPRIALPGIGLRASERVLMLRLVDYLLLAGALVTAVHLRTDWLDAPNAIASNWRWFFTLAVVWWIVSQLAESHDLARAASAPNSILTAGAVAAITVLIYEWIPLVTPPLQSRKLALVFAALAVGATVIWRGVYAVLFVQPAFERRLLVLGAGGAGRALAAALRRTHDAGTPNPYRGTGAVIVGFVDDAAETHVPGAPPGQYVAGVPVLGRSPDITRLARAHNVDEVVLAITNRELITQEAFDALLACREQGFTVTTMPSLYERLLGRVPVEHVGRNLSAVLPVDEPGPADRVFQVAKRLVDLAFAVVGLLVLAVTAPFVALNNALSSPGPLFYRQTRVGQAGRPFRVLKYRTMRPDAEAITGAVWAAGNDPRITPAGRFLRKSRLDELPQVVNVLLGQMSMIGPRPERPEFIDRLAGTIPFYRARHAVKPGITGWAQVRHGYGNTIDDARIKLEYDLYYARHAGFYLDTLIGLKTLAVILKLQGK